MSERNAEIVRLHVEEELTLTLTEIGLRLGLTRERVRQIVKKYYGETLTWSRRAQARRERDAAKLAARLERKRYRASIEFYRDRSIVGEDGCWIWQGTCLPTGYGRTSGNRGSGYAHRGAWETANGRPVSDGFFVCHSCDVPSCVNPAHLFVGTCKDNVRDSISKGRFRPWGHPRKEAA